MSSLNSILNTAGSAIMTYQSAISVTGQNIANVDNSDYSVQSVVYAANTPVSSSGLTFGTGVAVTSVTQSVNQTLENLLTSELSVQTAMEEASVYMAVIEDLLAEGTDDSLNTLLDNYWSAWESLSNNPSGATEQELVYETGIALAQSLNDTDLALDELVDDLNRDISSGVDEINTITAQLAALNQAIIAAESAGGNANDLNDQRNALVDDLGELIDIDVTVKDDGSYLITTVGGLPLVDDALSYPLAVSGDDIQWCGSSGTTYDITDDISGGALAGWLEIRDAVIPETLAELDELASQLIWTLNYQHAQGAGQTYFSGSLEGTYAAGDSGLLASLAYGDQIDYTRDFSMVIRDGSGTDDQYQTVEVDMGISSAVVTDIEGSGEAGCTWEITVVDEGVLGDQILAQTQGDALGSITTSASGDVAEALDSALAQQILTIAGGSGTQTVEIGDTDSDAIRSAADIAEALNDIDGITAYASSTEVSLALDGITGAQDGDIVQFTLYVDGVEQVAEFTVDSDQGTLEEQFEACLADAAGAINETNQDTDLLADGSSLSSLSGATIGIQDFQVLDNAGVTLDNFQNFDTGDTLTLTVSTDGSDPTGVQVTVDLTDVDTTDEAEVAQAFYDALSDALTDGPFTVELDETTAQITLRTTDGTGVSLSSASGDTGDDASISVTALDGSSDSGDGQLDFDGSDIEGAVPDTSLDDYLVFALPDCEESGISSASAVVGEDGGAYDVSAVLTGSITLVMDPGMAVSSDDTTGAGLFGTNGSTGSGNSLITLGGTGGFENFDDGDTITLAVDGYEVSYTVSAASGQLTNAEQAQQLYDALEAALPDDEYEIIQSGTSISILRTAEADEPLTITGFTDDTGGDAALAVSTGTGEGAEDPENSLLGSGDEAKDSAVAATYGDPATIYWEIFDADGFSTGESGYVEIDEPGLVEIGGDASLSFEISEGSLTAGNTLRINADEDGEADPPVIDVSGTGASIDDTYEFTVVSGGTLPDNEDPIEIQWTSDTGSGTITLAGGDDPDSPLTAEVGGMTLYFYEGTLADGDVFYLATDEDGDPGAVETLSDWHWTLDSFAEEFNRSAGGVTASVTDDNTLAFETNSDYCAIENLSYSGAYGIDAANAAITVLDYTALEFEAEELQFTRTGGTWEIENDPTGGTMQLIPEGGDDDGFEVDLDGDGLGDIRIEFDQSVTGDGTIQMDLVSREADDFQFAFAGDEDGDSGLAAALGINTYFTGIDAGTIGVNEILADGDYIASGMVDTDTGELSAGDNTNALAMADTRYQDLDMKQWDYTRGEDPGITLSTTTLDDYQAALVASVGFEAQSIQTSLEYSELMVYQLTQERDAVSAVSLDEEMINLTAQQQAYMAASQLLTTVDEMFDALLSAV